MHHFNILEISFFDLLLEVGLFNCQLFDGDKFSRRFQAGTKWRLNLTIFGTVHAFFYLSFEIYRICTKLPSIDKAGIDFVWLVGNICAFIFSIIALLDGHRMAAFGSKFLHFAEQFKGTLQLQARKYRTCKSRKILQAICY
jgi:hypothetical protein